MVDENECICSTFPHDAACRILLKLTDVSQSYYAPAKGTLSDDAVWHLSVCLSVCRIHRA